MTKTTLIPFGPQHPSFLEPLNINLRLDEERVVGADINYGFNHRGMEKAMAADFRRTIYLCERVCGICSFFHSTAYCRAMESMYDVEVPENASNIRVILMECQRITSHSLALAHTAEAMGYESLFMQLFREREPVMHILNDIAGNRVHYSMNTIGGVRRDISPEQRKELLSVMDGLEKRFAPLADVLRNDATIRRRMVGKGVLSREDAMTYGAVGPVSRASGIPQDLRQTYYLDLDFHPIVREEGDSYARSMVRVDELIQSIGLIRTAVDRLRDGPLNVPAKGNPTGESFSRLEAPRGELFYYVKANGKAELERVKVKTPAFVNVAALTAMVPGCEMPDVPVITVSVDPCICCTER